MGLSNIVKNKDKLTNKKKKKSLFNRVTSFLSNPLRKAYKTGTELVNSNEGKALGYTITHPKEVIRAAGNNLNSVGDKLVNNKLLKSNNGTLAGAVKKGIGQFMEPVGNLVKASSDIFTGIADTTDKVQETRKKIDEGKLSVGPALIDTATTVGLQGASTIAAPIVTGVNGLIKQFGIEKDIEHFTADGQKWLDNLALKISGAKTDKEKNNVKSIVQATINGLQMATMFKGMKHLGNAERGYKLPKKAKLKSIENLSKPKQIKYLEKLKKSDLNDKYFKIKETAKGGLTMGAVPIALTVIGAVTGTQGKKTPTLKKIGELGLNSAILAGSIKPLSGLKGIKKINIKNVVKEPTLNTKIKSTKEVKQEPLSTKIKSTKEVKQEPLSTKIKSTKEVKQEPLSTKIKIKKIKLTPKQKSENKINRNIINQLVGLNYLKKTGDIYGISDKQTSLNIKKDLIKQGLDKGLLKEGGIDNGNQSYLFTQKAYNLGGAKGKGIHIPLETKTTKTVKTKTDKEVKQKPLSTKIKATKEVKQKPLSTKIKATKDKEIINKTHFEETVSVAPDIKNIDLINNIKKGDVVLKATTKAADKLGIRRGASILLKNLGGVLNSINIKTKDGIKSLNEIIDGIKSNSRDITQKTLQKLGYDDYIKIENKNTKGINTGYDFVKKNIDKFFPGKDLISRILKEITLKEETDLYNKIPSVKGINTTKARVILNAVNLKTKQDINKIKQKKIEEIKSKGYPKDVEKDLIDNINIDYKKILNDNIKLLPKEVQKFVREVNDKFNLFSPNSFLKKGFKDLSDELNLNGIKFKNVDDYIHGYIDRGINNKFKNELGKLDKNLTKFEDKQLAEILDDAVGSPETRTGFLKKRKNAWFLHSGNPIDIMTSYANQYSTLITSKIINRLLDKIGAVNKKAGKVLEEELGAGHNFLRKKLLGLNDKKNIIEKGAHKLSSGLSKAMYIGNIPMTAQNVSFLLSVGVPKSLLNLATGKSKLVGFKNSDISGVRKYLFERGLLGHKDYNIDLGKGNVKLGTKLKLYKKQSLDKLMRLFTATFVQPMQTMLAQQQMAKIVDRYGGLKKGETVLNGFKRITEKMDYSEKSKINGEIARTIKDIEDASYSNTATTKALDFPFFNMIHSFSRGNANKITSDLRDIIEIFNKKEYKGLDKELYKKAGISGVDLIARTYGIMLFANALANLLGGTEDEKDKIKESIFAKNMKDYLVNTFTTPIGLIGPEILSAMIPNIGSNMMKFFETDDKELKKKYLADTLSSFMTGPRKFIDINKNLGAQYLGIGKHTTKNSANGGFAYKNTNASNPFYGLMGINPTSAAYSNLYNKLDEYRKDLPKDWIDTLGDYIKTSGNISKLVRNTQTFSDKLRNARQYAKVETAIKRLSEMGNKYISVDKWINTVIPNAPEDIKNSLSKTLYEAQKKTTKELEQLNKLGIRSDKRFTSNSNNFNTVLNMLKVHNPRAYENVMQKVLSYYSVDKGLALGNMKNMNKDFISNLLSQYMHSTKMATTVATQLNKTLKDVIKYKYNNQGKVADKADGIEEITKLVDIIKQSPELYNQVKESLAELLPYSFKRDELQSVYDVINQIPGAKDLYKIGKTNRGGLVEKIKNNDIMKKNPEKDNKIETNKEDLGIKNGVNKKKISSLMKMKYQKLIDEKQLRNQLNKNNDINLKALEVLIKK